ncbi:MAG: type IX secretion system membrane protein PorP/SprF [Bacteroidales bacterium]
MNMFLFNKHVRNTFLIILLLSGTVAKGQQVTSNSLFNLNRLNYNPAFAGASDKIPISLHVRQQWMGFDDAPRSQYMSTHAFLPLKIGLGSVIFNNITGPTRQTGMKLAFSKHFRLNEEHWFSLGLSAEVFQNLFETGRLETNIPGDPAITGELQQRLAPDASTGLFFYSENYFAGFSVINLMESKWDLFETSLDFNNPVARTFYLTGGYVFTLNELFRYQPSVLVKKSIGLPLQLDACNQLYYRDFLWAGASFRTNLDGIIMTGFRYSIFEFVYAFDITFGEIRNYNHGSHEIILRFNLSNPNRSAYKYLKRHNQNRFAW